MHQLPRPSIVLVAGPTGVGKSTLGRALAGELGWSFVDADDLHAPASVERMRSGQPLSDEERWPWLGRVREVITQAVRQHQPLVVACSALRDAYRRYLTDGVADEVLVVFLTGTRALLEHRVGHRQGHFAPAALVRTQLEMLETPAGDAVVLDAGQPLGELVRTIRRLVDVR